MPYDEITVARVKWDGVKVVTARELWQDKGPRSPTPRQEAAAFIKQAMRDQDKPGEFQRRLATEIEAEAKEEGIALKTLKRAKKESASAASRRRAAPTGGGRRR